MALFQSIRLRVTYTDGRSEEVSPRPKELVGFERHFAIPLEEAKGSIEQLCYVAWLCLFNAGKEPRDFDTWLEVIADIDYVDEGPADPTSEGQSAD